MSFILRFFGGLSSSALLWVAGAVLAALVSTIGVQTWRVHSLQVAVARESARVAEKTAALETATVDLREASRSMVTQNRAIADLKAASAAQAKTLQDAQAHVESLTAHSRAVEAALDAEKVPVDCQGASEWLAEKAAAQTQAFGTWK